MGACDGGIDKRYKRIEELRSKFPEYHREDGKLKGYTYDQKDEEALIEYWKRFTSKKDELSKSNPKLFYVLFNRNDQDSKRFTYEGLKTDDEEKFYFFFNKRRFEELNLSESILVFPRFSYQQFPYYKDEKSLLTSINIKSSTILFDGLLPWYQKLESLQYLSLSYNNITNIPENFSSFQNLKELNLRRNKLSNLPKTFEKMNNLVNVDLSENEFTTCPKELFVKSEGESKLQKLNMSSNQLQLFEIPGLDQNESLKYLFLSDNKIQKLPNDIKKLKGLLFVNLDDNLIKDCDNVISDEMPKNLKVSMNSPVNPDLKWEAEEKKDKAMPKPSYTPKNTYNPRMSTVNLSSKNSQPTTINFRASQAGFSRTKTNLDQKDVKDELDEYLMKKDSKEYKTELESNLAEYMRNKVKEQREDTKHDISDKIKTIEKKRFFHIVDQLSTAINNNKENEVADIEDLEIKILFKKAYALILRKKKFEITGKLEPEFEHLDRLEQEYFIEKVLNNDPNKKNEQENEEDELAILKQPSGINKKMDKNEEYKKKIEDYAKNCISVQKEDISNLKFMKEINREMTSHKIRFYLQYIRNIDNNLYDQLLNIWETQDRSSFIVTLTEIKIFINEMLGKFELDPLKEKFPIEKTEDKNVVHAIFYDEMTRNFLKQMGLSKVEKSKINGIQQDIFTFIIKKSDQEIMEEKERDLFYKKPETDKRGYSPGSDNFTIDTEDVKNITFNCYMQEKYYLVDKFLEKFIEIMRTSKFEPIDLEGP